MSDGFWTIQRYLDSGIREQIAYDMKDCRRYVRVRTHIIAPRL